MATKRRIAIALNLEQPYPHHTRVFAGTQQYADEHGWECVIDEFPGYRSRQRPRAYRRYDGVIARARPEMARRVRRQKIPLVNTWYSTPMRRAPSVYPDHQKAARLAAEHLLDRGFRQICLFNTIGSRTIEITQRAMERLVDEAGGQLISFEHLAVDALDVRSWIEQERSLSQALDHLKPPVGIFCGSSSAMRYVVNLCQGRGWNVPRDVAVISSMPTPGLIDHPRPAISYIDMNWEQVGYEAAALLERLMAGERAPARAILIPPRGVVARESTDYFAVDDKVVAEALYYIATHLRDRLSVERIAEHLLVSSRKLQLRFDAALGRTISGEIRRLRLEAAKRMLADQSIRIAEIAEQTGFVSSTRMNEVFRRELHMTPGEYRKAVEEGTEPKGSPA